MEKSVSDHVSLAIAKGMAATPPYQAMVIRKSVSARSRKPADSKQDRWRSFSIADVKERDFKFDSFTWLKEE